MFAFKKIVPFSGLNIDTAKPSIIEKLSALSCFAKLITLSDMSNPKRHTWTKWTTTNLDLSYQKFAEPEISVNTIPIIVLHGLLGSKNNWNTVCRALAKQNFRTIMSVDARNHGDSPHIDDFSYEAMVADTASLLKNHNYKKASFIGHSMGGRTLMLLAQLYPELVHSMVIVDISPVGQSPNMLELPKLFSILKNLDLNPDMTLAEARKQTTAKLNEHKLDQKLISFLLTNLVEDDACSKWRWKFNIPSISEHFESDICRFPIIRTNVPTRTLFIGGMDSDYLRPEDEPRIKVVFPEAKFNYIKGAGHWVHADKPHEFIEIVSAFFKKERKYFEV